VDGKYVEKCRLIGGEDIKTPLANEDARGVLSDYN
jgi:hypothetical protein